MPHTQPPAHRTCHWIRFRSFASSASIWLSNLFRRWIPLNWEYPARPSQLFDSIIQISTRTSSRAFVVNNIAVNIQTLMLLLLFLHIFSVLFWLITFFVFILFIISWVIWTANSTQLSLDLLFLFCKQLLNVNGRPAISQTRMAGSYK